MHHFLSQLKPKHKYFTIISYDLLIISSAFLLSFILRFNQFDPDIFRSSNFLIVFIITITVQFLSFYFNGLYKGIWRFSSTPDLICIIKGSFFALILTILSIFLFNRLQEIPRSIFIIDWLLLVVGLGSGRFIYRIWTDATQRPNSKECQHRVLIVGAEHSGFQLAKEILSNKKASMKIVGFIDNNLSMKKRTINGIEILGPISGIKTLSEKYEISHIFIAIPDANSETIRDILRQTQDLSLVVKTLPRLDNLLQDKPGLAQLRNINTDDLLGRDSVKLDLETVQELIFNKKILVTGAGGSIGSELCKQIARQKPSAILAFETTELFLYELELSLNKEFPKIPVIPLIADVRDIKQVKSILKRYRPDVIFHAAAYKHVPMMEKNPLEAIKTNILGTKNLVESALEFQVNRFVLISTDKAVNPTNIMGASKRIAEIICQNQSNAETKFMTVRFGNVLGSSGSVIPLFKKQIEAGGPITVTHPEITRYFMSIPEAAQLVIQAGALGDGSEIFVLEMGVPVKIIDLAKELVILSGLKLNKDIQVEFTGLRPGEKLYEELFSNMEETIPTSHNKIKMAKARKANIKFHEDLNTIVNFDKSVTKKEIYLKIKDMVPEFDFKEDVTFFDNDDIKHH